MRESGKTYRSELWKLTELEFAEWPFAVVAHSLSPPIPLNSV